MLDQKEIEKVKNIGGYVRGVTFNTDYRYILKNKGREGVGKVENRMKEYGFEIEYKKINNTDWYPLSLRTASLLVIREVFNWGDDELFDMGYAAPKFSFFVKTLIKFFASVEKTIQETSKYWQKHYSVGELEVKEIDMENNNAVAVLRNFEAHPVFCSYFRGYFKSILGLIISTEEMNVEEVECVFRGDEIHEFHFEWK